MAICKVINNCLLLLLQWKLKKKPVEMDLTIFITILYVAAYRQIKKQTLQCNEKNGEQNLNGLSLEQKVQSNALFLDTKTL